MIAKRENIAELLAPFADHARVWIYQSSRELNAEECRLVQAMGNDFIAGWNTHGKALQAGFLLFYNRFLVIVADESAVKASGCSIDSSVRLMREIEHKLHIELLNRLNLAFRNTGGAIECMPMADFQGAIASGKVTPETVVFNNLAENVAQLKTSWEVAAKNSWHKQLF